MLPEPIANIVESLSTLAWAEGGDSKYFAGWQRGKLVAATLLGTDNAEALFNSGGGGSGGGGTLKERYLSACRSDAHRAIEGFITGHPAATDEELRVGITAQVEIFKAQVAVHGARFSTETYTR
jgi:hypothetical protein